jgi:dCTP deaminase
MKSGVLPDWKIKELIKEGVIKNADVNLVNTSSLDLRIGLDKWKVIGSVLPLPGQDLRELLTSREVVDDTSSKEDFYVDLLQPYIMQLVESLDLPSTISARIFNKSGRGRIAISTKGLTDGNPNFDFIKNGYKGPLYAEITATSFPLFVHSGITAIPQIRFYEGNPEPISGSHMELLLRKYPILTDDKGNPSYDEKEKGEMIDTGKLTYTADIPKEGLMSYVAKRDRRTLDLALKDKYISEEFYDAIVNNGKKFAVIHPGNFMLINSKQNTRLPPIVAAEIDEYSPELGDMKSHYAGLINASHGFDPKNPNVPSHIVFEIRARDIPILIQDNQPLAKFNLFEMQAEPEQRYENKKSTGFETLNAILPVVFKKD